MVFGRKHPCESRKGNHSKKQVSPNFDLLCHEKKIQIDLLGEQRKICAYRCRGAISHACLRVIVLSLCTGRSACATYSRVEARRVHGRYSSANSRVNRGRGTTLR